MSEKKPFLQAAGIVGMFTLLSRFLGLFRDMALASVFGASRMGDIFLIAFELPNLTRRVLGEGSLSAFIVPIFSRVRAEMGEKRGWLFASNALTTMGLFTTVLTLLGMWFAPQLFSLLGAGYVGRGDTEAIRLGTELTRIMFPFQIMLALSALMMGFCHSLRHFTMPSLGSSSLNITMIIVALFSSKITNEHQFARIMGYAVLLGVFIRLVIMIPPLMQRGFRYTLRLQPSSPHMRELYLMMLPATFGMAVAQINVTVSRAFATSLGEGNVPCLMFSNHLVQMPLAIIAGALGTAILPQLSQYVIQNRREELENLVRFAFRIVLILFMPAMLAFMALGHPIVEVLFQRKNWDAVATEKAYWALLFYAPALIWWGMQQILLPLYYARKDIKTTVWTGVAAMVLNIILNVILLRTPFLKVHLGLGGLALANTLGVVLNTTLLQIILTRRGMKLWDATVTLTALKTLAAACVMGAAAWGMWHGLYSLVPHSHLTGLFLLAVVIIVSAGIYFATAFFLQVPDLREVFQMFMRKFRKPSRTTGA